METSFKKIFSPFRLFTFFALTFCATQHAVAQSTPVSGYTTLVRALNAGVTTITNFGTNTVILFETTTEPTIQITTNVVIDAGNNFVRFQGNGTNGGTRFFTVSLNASLTVNNLEFTGGGSTNGGAIYNAGTLIVSNCVFATNYATNNNGVNGSSGLPTLDGNGGNGTSGGNASGGAIYSTGPLTISYSIFTNNLAQAGNGGYGGNAGGGEGNGGNAGNGGSAYGGAVFSSGSNNFFYMTSFAANECVGGFGGTGGSFPTNEAPAVGSGGVTGLGGSCGGGGAFVTGTLYMTNCIFYGNVVVGGQTGAAEVDYNQGGANGSAGGFAVGAGLGITNGVTGAWIQNSIFFDNLCYGGVGGSTALNAATGGSGGQALGGGIFSGANLTQMSFCTLATNLLTSGPGGSNSAGGFSGAAGATGGWNIYSEAGVFELSDSILSFDSKGTNNPNAFGVTDEGYNVSSDETPGRNMILPTTLLNTNAQLDSGLSAGVQIGGSFGSPLPTLLLITNSPAGTLVPGVPGLTFPATDETLTARRTPTSAGATELYPAIIELNADLPEILSILPGTNFTGANDTVSFTTTIDAQAYHNPLPFGYQWQLDGTNIYDNANYSGTTANVLTVKKITFANQGSYTVVVSPTLLEGAVTSPVVYLVLTNPPSITTQPVSELNRPSGSIVTFTVGVISPLNYDYHWMLNGAPLSGSEFSGTNSNVLTIDPATAADEGTYSVVVSNNYGAVTSANVHLTIVTDKTRPTLAILSPAANVRTNSVIMEGTATDNAQVTNVLYWITNINAGLTNPTNVLRGSAVLTTNGNTNLNTASTIMLWSIAATPLPGTNILAVQAVDASSNVSVIQTRHFFYEVTSPLLLHSNTANGAGTVTGKSSVKGDIAPTNGAPLNIGEGYSIVAVPNSTSLLGSWTVASGGNVETTNGLTLKFIMEANTSINVLFVNNAFVQDTVHGAYNGLFYVTSSNSVVSTNLSGTNNVVTTNETVINDITVGAAGMLDNLVIGKTGSYTGKLLLAGTSYPLSGAFSAFGQITNKITRTDAAGGSLYVEMNVNTNGSGVITGSVSNAAWPTNAYLWAALASTTGNGNYTLLMLPSTNAATNALVPPGDGYALMAEHSGKVTLSGGLADGATFTESVPASQSGYVPVYVSLYDKTGLVIGWLDLGNLDSTNASGELTWIKGVEAHPTALYPGGFNTALQTEGSIWTPLSAITLSPGSTLTVSNSDPDLIFPVQIEKNDQLFIATGATNAPSNSLTGAVNLKTGQLEITFGNGNGRATTRGYGAVLISTNGEYFGGGYFVTPTSSGSVTLQP